MSNVLKRGMLQKEKVVVRIQNVYLKSIKFDMHIVYISRDVELAVRYKHIDISFH